jgi:hypothetical protein
MSYRNELNAYRSLRTVFRILIAMSMICMMAMAQADEMRYVWALQGANLRDTASANGKVMTKLNYGDAVTVLPPSGERVPYDLSFFPKVAGQTIKPDAMPVLSGAWVKVQANGQQGYVFDKLLLRYEPIKKGEETAKYLARIFGLTEKLSKGKDGSEISTYTAKGKNKAYVEVTYYPQSSGSTSYATIPELTFDEAFVFFNAIMPPDLSESYTYHRGDNFEYRGRGGCGCRLTLDEGAVRFDWFDEP